MTRYIETFAPGHTLVRQRVTCLAAALLVAQLSAVRAAAQDRARACPSGTEMRGAVNSLDMGAVAGATPAAARVTVDSARAVIRIIAGPYRIAGGSAHHAHDASMEATVLRVVWNYGVELRLEDAKSGKVLARLRAHRAEDGRIRGVSRFNFGFHEDGLRLDAGHQYRIVAEYDNPTGAMLSHAGMGFIASAFAPDDLTRWPRLDRADPDLQRDEASLAMADMSMP